MPFYSYLCDDGHEFEVEQRITEDALTECNLILSDEWSTDKCEAPCRRQLSKSSFQLRGGGWSQDGYAKVGKG